MHRGSGQLSNRLSGPERLFRIFPIEVVSPTSSQSSEKLVWISHFLPWNPSSQEIAGQGFDRGVFWRLSCRRVEFWGVTPAVVIFFLSFSYSSCGQAVFLVGEGLVRKGPTGGDFSGGRNLIKAEIHAVFSRFCDPR